MEINNNIRKSLKTATIIAALNFIFCLCYSQETKSYAGEYSYNSEHFYESILLKPNGQFIYKRVSEFIRENINGNWQIRNKQIVLDSYPQHDRLLVYEELQKSLTNKIIYVYNKRQDLINYTLVAVTTSGDTTVLKDQWKCSIVDRNTKEFFLIDNKGLKSPLYFFQGTRSNKFKVLFETTRVFENELWEINSNRIIPKNESGVIQKYFLEKKGL